MALKRRNVIPIMVIATVLVVIALMLSVSNRVMPVSRYVTTGSTASDLSYANPEAIASQGLAGEFQEYDNEPAAPREAADGLPQTEVNAQERVILKTASLRIVVDAADA